MNVRFGPAGNPPSFYASGHKSSLDMPLWLSQLGLNAYEYQCVRGVSIKKETACRLGELARENDIALSIHAPYYISLGTFDPVLREKTKMHLLKSIEVACWMSARVVVFHPGGGGKDRKGTMARAKDLLKEILDETSCKGWDHIKIAPETAGKPAQLGNLEEVLEFCTLGHQVIPAIDFGHLHAASQGKIGDRESVCHVLDKLESFLDKEATRELHIHFSPVEFTKGGEKKHWTTLDTQFGPEFAPLARVLAERGLSATIICESAGRQAEDALVYKQIYLNEKERTRSF